MVLILLGPAMNVCIVVPMYNEEKLARRSVKTILSYVRQFPPGVVLLVVDDGSDDRTGEILQDLTKQDYGGRLHILSTEVNIGYGGALRTGIQYAVDNGYDYVLFMDSDLTNHPRYIEKFYEKMTEGWDYIKATRYSNGGGMQGVPWIRKANSVFGNAIARFLYGLPLTDVTNGFRAVKVNILSQINTKENGFAVIMEELYWAKHLTDSFCDVPYILTARSEGEGGTHFSYTPRMYLQYLYYAFRSFFNCR
ncbi:MAG: glycosyltransferase family 2 protein [Desulfobacteraceae bacterium]|nr:glycosyltransferase family 2 protein [Desulfobacteraceae bacterium]